MDHWIRLEDGSKFLLETSREYVMGRGELADIKFSYSWVSRYHAVLKWTNSKWSIVDTGSQNGILSHNVRVPSKQLDDGDIVTLGMLDLEYRFSPFPDDNIQPSGVRVPNNPTSPSEQAGEVSLAFPARGSDRDTSESLHLRRPF